MAFDLATRSLSLLILFIYYYSFKWMEVVIIYYLIYFVLPWFEYILDWGLMKSLLNYNLYVFRDSLFMKVDTILMFHDDKWFDLIYPTPVCGISTFRRLMTCFWCTSIFWFELVSFKQCICMEIILLLKYILYQYGSTDFTVRLFFVN